RVARFGAAHHIGKSVIQDRDTGSGGLRPVDARGVLLYSARNRARGPGSIRHGAIEVDQPVASRFVAGTHRIVRVHGNLARAMSENLPEPGLLILRCYRRSDSHAADALASLQFSNPETFAVAVTGGADK